MPPLQSTIYLSHQEMALEHFKPNLELDKHKLMDLTQFSLHSQIKLLLKALEDGMFNGLKDQIRVFS